MDQFTPQYIFESELQFYGLPTPDVQVDIMSLIQFVSGMIDENCGRFDGDGNGSLVYTTYTSRILLQNPNRNLFIMPTRPITPVDATTVAALEAAASASGNYFYTGVLPNTVNAPAGNLSGIIGASGRYGYTRNDRSLAYPDLFAFINPLNLVTMFGGPAPWVPIDVTNTDYDPKTGEVWVPAGLQLQKYSEVLIQWNSGWNPLAMPKTIKQVTAAAVKNVMARGGGTTGLRTMSVGRSGVNVGFEEQIIDPVLDRMLTPFRNVSSH